MTDLPTLMFGISKNDKPLLYLSSEHRSRTSCLVDTGADLPVWFLGDDYLKYRYPGAVITEKKTILNGMGENPIMNVPIWNIPMFEIADDSGNRIQYIDLPIAVIKTSRFSFDMIIPITMLNRMDISFIYSQSAKQGILKIHSAKSRFYCRKELSRINADYVNKIQIMFEDGE